MSQQLFTLIYNHWVKSGVPATETNANYFQEFSAAAGEEVLRTFGLTKASEIKTLVSLFKLLDKYPEILHTAYALDTAIQQSYIGYLEAAGVIEEQPELTKETETAEGHNNATLD